LPHFPLCKFLFALSIPDFVVAIDEIEGRRQEVEVIIARLSAINHVLIVMATAIEVNSQGNGRWEIAATWTKPACAG